MALTFQSWLNRDINFTRSVLNQGQDTSIKRDNEIDSKRVEESDNKIDNNADKSKSKRLLRFVRKLFSIEKYRVTLNAFALFLSACGLIWQVVQVSAVYFSYQTRVDIIISTPQALVIPGFTVCLDIVPNWTLVHQYFPDLEPGSPLLASYLMYLPINVLASMNMVNVSFDCRTSIPTSHSGPSSDLCDYFAQPQYTIHTSARYDSFKKCTTYFYNPDPDNPIRMLDFDARDFFTLRVYSEANYSVTVFVHNPREIIPFEESDSFLFYTQQTSRLVVTSSKVVTSLLPAPYRTNCTSYNNTEYGRTGCIYTCRLQEFQRGCARWPYNVPAKTTTEFPFKVKGQNCPAPRRYSCSVKSVCANQCNNVWYSTSLTYLRDKKDPTDFITRFSVRRPLGIEFEYVYGPRLDAIEFLCYLASALSMWMGISVFDLTLLTISWTRKRISPKAKKIKGVVVLRN